MYTLEGFVAAHAKQRAACAERLAAFRAEALRISRGACGASLEALELQLQTFTIKQVGAVAGDPLAAATGAAGGALGQKSAGLAAFGERDLQLVLGGLGATSGKRAAAALAALAGGGAHGGGGAGGGERGSHQEFSYTMAASRRAEQRRLLSFIRLVDAMISDTLHSCLVASVSEVLRATSPQEDAEQLQGSAAVLPQASLRRWPSVKQPAAADGPAAGGGGGRAPLFVVEAILAADGDALAFAPDPEEFKVGSDSSVRAHISMITAADARGASRLLLSVLPHMPSLLCSPKIISNTFCACPT